MVYNFAPVGLFTIRAAAGAATGDSDKWHMFHQRHDIVADGACG